jgi:uncharacterized RDD family membrane protein YckC
MGRRVTDPVESLAQRVAEQVVDLVVRSLDVNALVQQVDLNAIVDRVDVGKLVDRVDVEKVVGRVDLDQLLAEVIVRGHRRQRAGCGAQPGGRAGRVHCAVRGPVPPPALQRPAWPARAATVRRAGHTGQPSTRLGGRDHYGGAVTPPPAARLSFQDHFAGAASRLVAFIVDAAVSTGVFTLAVAGASFVASVITNHPVSWNRTNIIVTFIYLAWEFLYFAYSWAASGKTFGMALLGVRVISADGAAATGRQAVIRTLAFPLSFLLLGLGFLGIVLQRDRRALHDLIAGTAVIYAWDARAARLRFLARDNPPSPR